MKKNKNEQLFLIIWGIYLFYYIIILNSTFNVYFNDKIKTIIRIIVYCVGTLTCLSTKKSQKEWIIFGLCTLISFLIYFVSGELRFFELAIFVFGMKCTNFKKIAKISLAESSVLALTVVGASLLGIIQNYEFYREYDGAVRYAMGFSYVGQLPCIVFQNIFLTTYLRNGKTKKILLVNTLELLISYAVYKITGVRNTFIVSIMFIGMEIIYNKKRKNFHKGIKHFKNIYVILFIISLILANIYNPNNAIMKKLNNLLSYRLRLSNYVVESYDVKLFGNDIKMYGSSAIKYGNVDSSKYFYIDNLYIQLLYKYGVIATLIYIMYCTKILKNASLKEGKDNIIAIWLICMAASSLIGDTAITLVFNVALLDADYKQKNEE